MGKGLWGKGYGEGVIGQTDGKGVNIKASAKGCPAAKFQLGNEGQFLPHPLGELKSWAWEYPTH